MRRKDDSPDKKERTPLAKAIWGLDIDPPAFMPGQFKTADDLRNRFFSYLRKSARSAGTSFKVIRE